MDTADVDETIARNGTAPSAPTGADAKAKGKDAATAEADDGAEAAGLAEPAAASAPDVTSGFLSELTEAMMAVVGKERDRIGAIVEADAAGHLVEAKERATAEAEAYRQIADEDVASIEGWADAEVERIRADAARRIAERRSDLDTSLAQQEAVLDSELHGIETAVADYEVTLQSYLDDLRATGDPAEIAERAHSLPTPPALDDVRAMSRAAALTTIAEEAAAARGDEPVEAATDAADDDVPSVQAATDSAADDGAEATIEAAAPDATEDDAATPAEPDTVAATETEPSGHTNGTNPGTDDPDDRRDPAADDAVGAGIPVAAEGGANARTGWESDGGLEALMDPPARAVDSGASSGNAPVAVMDPTATASAGWEQSIAPVVTAVATAERGPVGHPNAAVRLIRSVAPWTAPNLPTDPTDTHPS